MIKWLAEKDKVSTAEQPIYLQFGISSNLDWRESWDVIKELW